MRIERAMMSIDKGWYVGPWNSDLPVSVGYASAGIDEPHVHSLVTEIYLVACGSSSLRIEQETFILSKGDVVIIEPGEAHTFLASSADYFHFVVHTPGMAGEKARAEKTPVSRQRLGLE